jgi:protein-S-isoprenylcysteine O-methyltransferase Ste14
MSSTATLVIGIILLAPLCVVALFLYICWLIAEEVFWDIVRASKEEKIIMVIIFSAFVGTLFVLNSFGHLSLH